MFYLLLVHVHVIEHLHYLGKVHKEPTDKELNGFVAFINRKATIESSLGAYFNKAPVKRIQYIYFEREGYMKGGSNKTILKKEFALRNHCYFYGSYAHW